MLKNILPLITSLFMLLSISGAGHAKNLAKTWILDRAFGQTGSANINIGQRAATFTPVDIIALDSGKSIVNATMVDPPNQVTTNHALIGLTEDGKLDLQFGVNGYIPFNVIGLHKVLVRDEVLYVIIQKEIHAFTLQGKPHPQFRQTNVFQVPFPRASDIYPTANGKWLLIADDNPTPIEWYDSRPFIVRLNANGTPDATFSDFIPSRIGYRGTDMRFLYADDQHIITEDFDQIFIISASGKFIRALNKQTITGSSCISPSYLSASFVTTQFGKYIVIGSMGTHCPSGRVSRVDLSGNLDRSFGKQGHVDLPEVRQIWRAPNDEGWMIQSGPGTFTKLDQTGQIDLSYGDNGMSSIREHLRYLNWHSAIAPNNTINMVAAAPTISATTVLLTHRLLPNGKSDETAGGSLAYTINLWRDTRETPTNDLFSTPDEGWLMPIYDDHLLNEFYIPLSNAFYPLDLANAIVKIKSNGVVDETFGDKGIWRATSNQPIRKVLQQFDGKIIVITNNLVMRLKTNGAVDPDFEPIDLQQHTSENITNFYFIDATLTVNNELWMLIQINRKTVPEPSFDVRLYRFSALGKALNSPNFNSNIYPVIGYTRNLKIHVPTSSTNNPPSQFLIQSNSYIKQYNLTQDRINVVLQNIEREQVLYGFTDGIVSKNGDYYLLYKNSYDNDNGCDSYWAQLTKINSNYTYNFGFFSAQLPNQVIRHITQQPDDTYLIATQKLISRCSPQYGYGKIFEDDITIVRLLPDGKLDAEFGNQGSYTVPGQQGFAQAAMALPNGDIVFNAMVKNGTATDAVLFKLTTASFVTAYPIKQYFPIGMR